MNRGSENLEIGLAHGNRKHEDVEWEGYRHPVGDLRGKMTRERVVSCELMRERVVNSELMGGRVVRAPGKGREKGRLEGECSWG